MNPEDADEASKNDTASVLRTDQNPELAKGEAQAVNPEEDAQAAAWWLPDEQGY